MTHAIEGGSRLVTRTPRARLMSLLVVLALGCSVPALPARAQPAVTESTLTEGTLAFTIVDPRITASSGLARDTDNGVFWTVNAASREGVAYAIGPDGRTRGTLEYDAAPLDAEAVAYANGRLYIADIGDNDLDRSSIRVYVFNGPAPHHRRGSNFTSYELVYPDGPHDAEALVVDGAGRITIVTKAGQAALYRTPAELRSGAPNELARLAGAPAFVTDATLLPSGDYALRTYVSVQVVDPEAYAPMAQAPLPYQPQGESLAPSVSDTALLAGSVGEQSRVLRVPIPDRLEPVPPGVPSPPPSPAPTTQAAAEAAAEAVPGPDRSGTFVALGLAVAVSVAAGAVVFLWGRHSSAEERSVPARRGRGVPIESGPDRSDGSFGERPR